MELVDSVEKVWPRTFIQQQFERAPLIVTFRGGPGWGVRPLHLVTFHLATEKAKNALEAQVLQRLLAATWKASARVVALGRAVQIDPRLTPG